MQEIFSNVYSRNININLTGVHSFQSLYLNIQENLLHACYKSQVLEGEVQKLPRIKKSTFRTIALQKKNVLDAF